ncbi:type 1 glutamine amidotransferase domain-containing protein [Micrococcus luteus]
MNDTANPVNNTSENPDAAPLAGRKVAFIASRGVEQPELTRPWEAVLAAGGTPHLLSPEAGTIQAMKGDWEHADVFDVDSTVSDADASAYAGVVLPGGTLNADAVRGDKEIHAFVRAVHDAGRPVAAICHAPWILIDAGLVEGRTLTSFESLRLDLQNAGATVKDEELVVDGNLITSRTPDDLDAFCAALVEHMSA